MGDLDVTSFVPVAMVAAIFGCVELYKAWYYNKFGQGAKLPWWFTALPFGLGLVIGFGNWFVVTDSTVILGMSIAKRILCAVYLGLGYGGASTILYELKKGFLGRNGNGNGNGNGGGSSPSANPSPDKKA